MAKLIKKTLILNNSKKYDIETEIHNYFANDILVHNCSVRLSYKNGKFVSGASRGNGSVGDDITENVKKMNFVPMVLKDDFTGDVRGEVLLSRKNKDKFFADKKKL